MIVALAFMTLLTFVQVVLRYGFGTGFVWSLEATTYAFAWLVLIGMSYGVRTEAHIAVDLVTSRLSPRAARVVAAAALACGLAYCALMIYGSVVFRRAPDDARQLRARHSRCRAGCSRASCRSRSRCSRCGSCRRRGPCSGRARHADAAR